MKGGESVNVGQEVNASERLPVNPDGKPETGNPHEGIPQDKIPEDGIQHQGIPQTGIPIARIAPVEHQQDTTPPNGNLPGGMPPASWPPSDNQQGRMMPNTQTPGGVAAPFPPAFPLMYTQSPQSGRRMPQRGRVIPNFMMPEKDCVLNCWTLSKWYGMVMGLNNVSLKIDHGVTGLLGPNGSGKSTFLKMMTGQLKPSQGKVFLLGEEVWGNSDLMARVGYCPEQESFYHWMTGLEFTSSLLRLAGYNKTDALDMAENALRQMDMGDSMDRAIAGYSKGMRQRVKVAQAIAHDPDVLILDEPLSGTDPVGRVKIIKAIKTMENAGKDIIISSHVLHDVERITRNVVMINQGRVIAQGDIHSIRGLIDQHPHIVKITTTEPRRLASVLTGHESIVSMEFSGNVLIVKTAKPDVFYRDLPGIMTEHGITYSELTSPDDNLDAVFRYLVE